MSAMAVQVFVIVWVGAAVVSINSQLLGGKVYILCLIRLIYFLARFFKAFVLLDILYSLLLFLLLFAFLHKKLSGLMCGLESEWL